VLLFKFSGNKKCKSRKEKSVAALGVRYILYMANANVTRHYDKTRVDNQGKITDLKNNCAIYPIPFQTAPSDGTMS